MNKFIETASVFSESEVAFGHLSPLQKRTFDASSAEIANIAKKLRRAKKTFTSTAKLKLSKSVKGVRLVVSVPVEASFEDRRFEFHAATNAKKDQWRISASETSDDGSLEHAPVLVKHGRLESALSRYMTKVLSSQEDSEELARRVPIQAIRAMRNYRTGIKVARQRKAANREKRKNQKSHQTMMRQAFAKMAEASGFKPKRGALGLGQSRKAFVDSKGNQLKVSYKGGKITARFHYKNLEGKVKWVSRSVRIKGIGKDTSSTQQSLEAKFRQSIEGAVKSGKEKLAGRLHKIKKMKQKMHAKNKRRAARDADDQQSGQEGYNRIKKGMDHDDQDNLDDYDGGDYDGGDDGDADADMDGGDFFFGSAEPRKAKIKASRRIKGRFTK